MTTFGQIISHYKILDKLGEGGMGAVFEVQDTKLNGPESRDLVCVTPRLSSDLIPVENLFK